LDHDDPLSFIKQISNRLHHDHGTKQHEHGTVSFGGAYPPLPFKKNKPENIRYKNYSTQTDKLLVNQLLGYVQMMNMQYFAQFTPRV
jgi:hypothetical protein